MKHVSEILLEGYELLDEKRKFDPKKHLNPAHLSRVAMTKGVVKAYEVADNVKAKAKKKEEDEKARRADPTWTAGTASQKLSKTGKRAQLLGKALKHFAKTGGRRSVEMGIDAGMKASQLAPPGSQGPIREIGVAGTMGVGVGLAHLMQKGAAEYRRRRNQLRMIRRASAKMKSQT